MGKKRDKIIKFSFNGEDYALPDRQKLFCMEYVRNKFNASEAARVAGYSAKTCGEQAYELLKKPQIQEYIKALKNDIAHAIGVSAIDIAQEYAKIGFSDIRQIFDDSGNLIKIQDIDDKSAGGISSIEIFEVYTGQGENREPIGQTKKVKFYDKVNALDKLAKMLGVDGVTKVAQTDSKGGDIVQLPKKEFLS